MKAFQLQELGAPPALVETTAPAPAPGEVRLRVAACGLNFADLLMVKGTYQESPPLPFAPGMEMAGTVDALGEGVTHLSLGQRVVAFAGYGGLAEMAVVGADRCVPMPDAMPMDHAAAFIVAYGTSHLALTHRAALQPGETLVVTGAAGGVGLTAVELGAKMGAKVIAIARGADKLKVAQEAGAHHLIDAESEDIKGQLKALGGIDVAYDVVGGDLFDACFRAAKPQARIIVVGFAGGGVPQIKANHLLVKNISVIGYYWGGYLAFDAAPLTRSLTELLSMYEAGEIHPHISHHIPLENAAEGLDLLRSRRSTGKVVVTMAG
ncbi:NADPH:quinone oxidoreductase family protein [Alphaproteobacteria bacterium KMM 3653]|uniref:NADPH:quinone oxidoreductase family protein n=1 Tax=Harenicola maris TaxID=2841044 RepID=A0AAP2CMC3_9RHOB|nr:NADPH:quinone oxidoreductase family protein [Harenicola maris]